jgi:hypothetical protein
MLTPKLSIQLLLILSQYIQQAIKENEFKRWIAVLDASSFSLPSLDVAKYQQMLNAKSEPGFPDF